ncbi:ABC transporter ATP-binding protein [Endozoicomonas arenosclerae]|uniref:ABC transporter ATP-binding protein n=1 Tax=Endozoicomonas arenosclerae TaxID=1633495 RepID=UPI0009A167EF|nr:ABC transporter ATP-binding protein [Endozoicomonas arenosclerae]
MYKKDLSYLLHKIWQRSFKKLSSTEKFPYRSLSLRYDDYRPFKYLLYSVTRCAPTSTLILFLASTLSIGLSLYLSYILGSITEGVNQENFTKIKEMAFTMIAVWVSIPAVQVISFLANMYVSQNLRIAVVDHLSARLTYGDSKSVEDNNIGNLVDRIEVASVSLPGVVSAASETVIKLFSILVLVTIILSDVSFEMAIAAGLWITSSIFLSAYLAYTGITFIENAADTHSTLVSELTELIMNIPLIKSFLSNEFERERFNRYLNSDLEACRQVRSYWLLVQTIEVLYKLIFGFFFITYTFYQFNAGVFSVSELVTLLSLVIILSWHFESVAFNFVDFFDALGELTASLKEVEKISVTLPDTSINYETSKTPNISLEDVTVFNNEKTLLDSISLNINFGSKIAIVGESGSGKSTLLKILSGRINPDRGTLFIDSLPKLPTNQIGNFTSSSIQSAPLFNRSIEENIAYCDNNVSQRKFNFAINFSQSREFIENSKNGTKTLLSEQGASVSTGERQKMSIARAIYRDSPIYIFDEATSSIDRYSENEIIKKLTRKNLRKTVIFVTHRVKTAKLFDKIIVMKKGKIISTGTHDDLIDSCEVYNKIYSSEDKIHFST